MMRHNLRKARTRRGMTQLEMANYLGITLVYYAYIEAGTRLGSIELWDRMEELFHVSQRVLRENI